MKVEALAEQKDIVRGKKPRILYFDEEISPILAWTYGAYQSNIIKVEQDPKIISFAWQWEGEKKVHVRALNDYPKYKADKFNIDDKAITYELHGILEEAQVIIGHNSNNFDIKIANARFLHYGLEPISEKKYIDTLKMARKYFKMPKNTLDDIYRYIFQKKGKTKLTHAQLLWGCLNGDDAHWQKMKSYNKRDVVITRDVYLKIRPFDKNHPNLSFFTRKPRQCPKCLSLKTQSRGKHWLRTGLRKRYQCRECMGWFNGEILKDGIEKVKSY